MQSGTRRALFAVGLIAGSIALAGCGKSVAANAPAATGPVEVGVVTIQPQRVALTSELAGRTAPYMVSEVRPQVGGLIQKRLFKEGGDIKAGQVLYQIDPASYQAAYDSAKAALDKARANLGSIKLKADRYKELVSINAVSKQDFDDVSASLKQAEADVASAKAAVDNARINLDYTRITAPISGRIGRSSVTPGALVTANQTVALSTVQQLDPIYVDVTQASAQVLKLKRELAEGQLQNDGENGAKVKLTLEDGSSYPLEGRLELSEVTVDQGTGSITLRAVFPNPKHELLPGMYVRAQLVEGVKNEAILAPQQGVTRDNKGGATAMVVSKNGKAELRQLTTSRAIGASWLVTSGLNAGDQLIVEGLQKIKPGAPVKPVAATNLTAVQATPVKPAASAPVAG
ncbi:efflux RND transporter periplasmic adaptor subunit [Crenobacter sp. SG2303]|uniref:Efflux RND transporter periplasmic adaptor subunit n=1 Tax=Crenobacter oryzisoli TaxID=3056844 RepID=A0ABT7XKD3_9NEIS|nr:efflux RND transporter periplasmic adaptor subunit [Crenobacter sp. SG2303]MDN0074246.1 efflux RND transporter periplasmic adaptor subunit [Crenobacter sp. SG2303]